MRCFVVAGFDKCLAQSLCNSRASCRVSRVRVKLKGWVRLMVRDRFKLTDLCILTPVNYSFIRV